MIQAIIDVGSNTIRMAIYHFHEKKAEMIYKKKYIAGLASYLDNGFMKKDGIDKVCEILDDFSAFLKNFDIERVSAFATAAIRNCSNSKAVVEEIVSRTGINVRVITGDEEAMYDFYGAIHSIENDSGILADIGGASTELIYYKNRSIVSKISMEMGSLDFQTKYSSGILPSPDDAEIMRSKADEILSSATEFKDISISSICGIGGTFKGTRALYNEITGKKDNNNVPAGCLDEMIKRFVISGSLSEKDTIILMKSIPDRINTVIPGMIIADAIARKFKSANIVYSDSGVREGFIYRELME